MMRGSRLRLSVLATSMLLTVGACTKSSSGNGGSNGGTGSSSPPGGVLQTSEASTPGETPSGTGQQATQDLSGTWSGRWGNTTPDTATGTFELQWQQTGTKLTGTITIVGTPCLTGSNITGELRPGGSINFGVVQGQVEVDYTGKVAGDSMLGTYSTTCGNAEGNWKATHTG